MTPLSIQREDDGFPSPEITPQQEVKSPAPHRRHYPRTTRIIRKEIYDNMMQPNHHPNLRLVKTAPRPSRTHNHGLLRGIDESSSSSFDSGDPEILIRKNLFAPPVVVQNEIFRSESKAINHYQPQLLTQRNYHHHHSTPSAAVNRQQNRPESSSQRGAVVKRTGNDQYCGLSAEIAHAIAYRTPMKAQPTPMKTPSKSIIGRGILKTPGIVGILKTPAKSQPSETANTTATTMENNDLNLAQTVSLSSSSDDEASSSPIAFQFRPGREQPVASTAAVQTETKSIATKPTALHTPRTQPIKKRRTIRKTPFACASSRKRIKKSLTPPRKNFSSHMKLQRSSSANNATGTAFEGVNDYILSSSELDPSPFQVELPSKKEIVVHAKICALMDVYTAIHRDFNFAMLCGVSHSTLVKEYERSTNEKPMIAGTCHRDVVRELLACADDIVVEGFFREYTKEEKDKESERLEACILSSDSLRQIIVCFRGSTTNQAKPLKNASTSLFGKHESSCLLHEEDHKVQVLDTFRGAYFGTPLEKAVFALLSNLTTRKPFFDVVMTGHSFGAAMATIASFRYASSKPQMRVSCHVFSSPRIGGEAWRQLVHSVPNLRVYRAENGSDPYVLMPSGNEWVHCGHAVQIHDLSGGSSNSTEIEIKARRFDRDTATSTNSNLLGYVQSMVIPKTITNGVSSSQQGKMDHEMQSYVEKLTRSGEQWFTDFCEWKGKGLSGANDEMRRLA
ncbi:hypothetical protein ACHAWU_000883 [Discostella pseudostelligera]|uniref:Fungal lipase-type domain-containing protein n=1 Tax=Discostella pseudostelligera TaxID=259834 RepID=A0ABD3M0I7_9STRA